MHLNWNVPKVQGVSIKMYLSAWHFTAIIGRRNCPVLWAIVSNYRLARPRTLPSLVLKFSFRLHLRANVSFSSYCYVPLKISRRLIVVHRPICGNYISIYSAIYRTIKMTTGRVWIDETFAFPIALRRLIRTAAYSLDLLPTCRFDNSRLLRGRDPRMPRALNTRIRGSVLKASALESSCLSHSSYMLKLDYTALTEL